MITITWLEAIHTKSTPSNFL